jgi:hypothetical protein
MIILFFFFFGVSNLMDLGTSFGGPRLFLDDFNAILSSAEKIRG